MSEPTAGEVLGMLLEWREAQHAFLAEDDDNEDSLFVRLTVAERRLDKLNRAHLRTLANALTPPAPASARVRTRADVERDLTRWLLEGDRGMSSEAIACAVLRKPLIHSLPPADSDDFGRCLRLINRIPEARMGVTLLGVVNKGWAYLDGIWEDLTQLGIDAGMLERRCGHPEIDRLIRARPRG